MSEEQIKSMLEELTMAIDYDLYKEIFVYKENLELINTLMYIANTYINKEY